MADGRRQGPNQQLDIQQILLEAQHRWLRPAEICEILQNYRKFRIAPEPPDKPTSGSVFLFDRKVLRYFRKDGHNWRKKKDGKTVKEAHERLKAESVDVLHCYYAHGEENGNFQRRTYWLLEEKKRRKSREKKEEGAGDSNHGQQLYPIQVKRALLSTCSQREVQLLGAFMHIVLVHYLEVKGGKASYSRNREGDQIAGVSQMDSPACSNSFTSQNQFLSQSTEAGSPSSAQTSEYEDTDSDNYQTRSRYHSFLGLQQYENGHLMDAVFLNSNVPASSVNPYDHHMQPALTQETNLHSMSRGDIDKVLNAVGLDLVFSGSRTFNDLTPWDDLLEHTQAGLHSAPFPVSLETGISASESSPKQLTLTFGELLTNELNIMQRVDMKAEQQICSPEVCSSVPSKVNVKSDESLEGNMNSPFGLKQRSLEFTNIEGEGLKKFDSFSKWMSRELAEVDESHIKPSSQVWNFTESERVGESSMSNPEQDAYVVGPSVSQDQLFNIIDFSPNWAFSSLETKVLITGRFFKDRKHIEDIKLSCMFGEVEVPAEILADGILRCHAPPHNSGRVPFYITCSNRLACSEVREFEYRVNHSECMETFDSNICSANEMNFHIRLGKLLSLGSVDQPSAITGDITEKFHIRNKISSLLTEADDKWFNMLKSSNEKDVSPDCVKDQLLQQLLKEKLHDWLLLKVSEDGKGPNVLDKEGQGVLHLTAALGYDWAVKPIITAGVNINFRDVRGWTALHWAAFCGRERTVVSLITLGAAPGALTDPSPKFPSGRTPADLASGNGHKGIAGFLAESSLTSHLTVLTVKDTRGIDLTDASVVEGLENLDQGTIQLVDENVEAGLSLKDSLSAVRNAALAAARIHQVFRADSFQRKKLVEFGDSLYEISEKQTLSLVSVKTNKPGQHDMHVHAAAIKIQNKFRGWKGRKDFLITRQRIVTIQAHVRGHQVRKRYKKIVWTVSIVEKAILRWRRKGSGLRGFRKEGATKGNSMQTLSSNDDDDYDFLKEGRKQTEARLQTALARVKSMARYPEARDQYSRLLAVVSDLKASNDVNGSEDAAEDEIIVEKLELEGLCEDDVSFMQMREGRAF